METKKKVPLTQPAFDRLQEELAHLEGEARTQIIDDIATARAHGDLSENAEYHAAKDQQGLQEARIRQIKEMLENAEIIHTKDDGVIKPGKLVTLRYEDDEEPETYLLGLREERDGDHAILTPESPIGQALVGHVAGETLVAKVPAGDLKIEIVAVETP
ncbi:MAG: transcription elongation factor GreA [Actinomycetota bacterium]|jgi:transcription elongation factor GreA|nr:transcription elongation factor GreA [Actinomycetota bacterium]